MKDQKVRITSIDALRAVVLLGILLVHTRDLFGFFNLNNISNNTFAYFTQFDTLLSRGIEVLLSGRCNIIFSVLFGVSFHLILKNPNYSSLKFVWRCVLLMSFGVLMKFFYTYDALMWYGLMGILLVLFRRLRPRHLFVAFGVTVLLTIYLSSLSLGDMLFGYRGALDRYTCPTTLHQIVRYPLSSAIADYLRIVLDAGALKTLSYFLIGYLFAKSGIIDNLPRYANLKNVSLFALLYVAFFSLLHFSGFGSPSLYILFTNLSGGLFYAILFIYLYYKFSGTVSFSWLEAYGKLGLTNYCVQNLYGVVLMSTLFIPKQIGFASLLFCSVIFYSIQVYFSVVWLRYYKFGPLEWVWRCLTNMKFMSNRKF